MSRYTWDIVMLLGVLCVLAGVYLLSSVAAVLILGGLIVTGYAALRDARSAD